jgi:hypothetical protein
MPNGPRVSVAEARARSRSGNAILVCAYEDEDKCQRMRLEGARTLAELESMLPTLPEHQPIFFYCA